MIGDNVIFFKENEDGSQTCIQFDTGGPLVIPAEDYMRFGPRGRFSDHAQKILAEEAKLPVEEQERLARERRERREESNRAWAEYMSRPDVREAFRKLNEIIDNMTDEEFEYYLEHPDEFEDLELNGD